MKKIYGILFILAISSLILLAGCGKSPTADLSSTTGSAVKEETTASVVKAETSELSGNVKEFDVVAKQFEFDPATITVNKGDTVKLNIKSIDVAHGFALPDFNIKQRIDPGKEVTVQFVADKVGTFNFFCNVQCGSDHGSMRGQLIVE